MSRLICPICEQGSLNLVRLRSFGESLWILCRECEAVWPRAKFPSPDEFVYIPAMLDEYGLEADWGLEIIVLQRTLHPEDLV